MALQGSGAISIANISVELGRSSTATSSLGETTLRDLAGVASGAISMSNFYGKALGFVFAQTLSSNTTNYNLKSAAIVAGWDQVKKLFATITINSGVYVYSTSTGSYAFDTGSTFPTGSTLALINNGTIIGRGGDGGNGGNGSAAVPTQNIAAPGSSGGPAFIARYAISVTNNGTIGGGGGGGGGGSGGG